MAAEAKAASGTFDDWKSGLDEDFEVTVLQTPFVFWQYGGDCSAVPGARASLQTLYQWYDITAGWLAADDQESAPFFSYNYQAGTQLGYPILDERASSGRCCTSACQLRCPRRTCRRTSRSGRSTSTSCAPFTGGSPTTGPPALPVRPVRPLVNARSRSGPVPRQRDLHHQGRQPSQSVHGTARSSGDVLRQALRAWAGLAPEAAGQIPASGPAPAFVAGGSPPARN